MAFASIFILKNFLENFLTFIQERKVLNLKEDSILLSNCLVALNRVCF